nr:hypothetical protein [Tanacetum cinerariifolium]
MRHGFDLGYKTWVHHGELALPLPPPLIDNTRQPQMSDMTVLLNDLSYIPPNNEHNEPTQGDIGETSNEPTQPTRNEFEELYASANEELYPGCDYVTRLDFMAKFTYFKVKGKLTDSIFNEMLEFFQNVFLISKGYKLSLSYYAIKKTFKMIGLGYESIHACDHDCCLFRRKENKDLDLCPVCNTSRWKDSNTPGKKVPKKVLCYFSIIPRLQRLYKFSHTANEIIWHASGNVQSPDRKGVKTIDVASGQKFNMRAMVLWTINDFPARSSFSGWSGQGYKACPTCNKVTPYVRVLSKTAYVGHKRFLKKPYKLRSSLEFNGQTDNRDPPKEFCQDEILTQLDRLPMRVKGKHPSYGGVKIKRNVHVELNWTKRHRQGKTRLAKAGHSKWLVARPNQKREVLEASAQIKVVDILCDLELIYPPALFDIMIHLVIHLPLEDVTTKFIRPDRNVDPPPPTCQFQKVKWYVLHNSPEIDTYQSQFKSLFPNKDMKEEFPDWLGSQIRQRHIDNDKDPEVSTTSELFALACVPTWIPISVNSCVVDGVRYVVHSHDKGRTTQNSDICSPGLTEKCIMVSFKKSASLNKAKPHWKVVEHVNHKRFSNGGVIMVEDDPDIIHFDNSSDLPLSTSLNDLDNVTLHIDGQSTDVDAPPDIIDVPDEDDDIIDDEDAIPYDLADSDDEDLINVDDDGVDKVYSSEEED